MSDLNPPFSPNFDPDLHDGSAESAAYARRLPVEVVVVHPRVRRRYWLNIALLVATIFTTLVVGAGMQASFQSGRSALYVSANTVPDFFPLGWIAEHPSRLLLGLPFASTLLLILLAHEMGHYACCLHYGVDATLPFFIPAPTLIGTLGAFIRIRSPIRSREALFDIGIAGPIAGFLVGIWAMVFALMLSRPALPSADEELLSGFPLIFHLAHSLLRHGAASRIPLEHLQLHPTAIAAWVGMFATALNLLPGGQLDGGHIVYSIFPRAHKHVSRLTIGMLLPMGLFLWPGWLIWAALLGVSGLRHPRVPAQVSLSRGRRLLAVAALILLILTFTPEPFHEWAILSLPR